jgi:hypothetical protein
MLYGVKVTHIDKDVLEAAITVIMREYKKVNAIKMSSDSLRLKWSHNPKIEHQVPIPVPMLRQDVINFVWDWLRGVNSKQPPGPDGVGFKKGFEIRSGIYAELEDDDPHLALIISPVWLYFGK